MDNSFQLPPNFYTLTIGSIVDGETSKFSASVIQASITKMVPQSFGTKFMSGNSSYVYSDKMNQGSFEISGSYGVSGIAKVSAGISGYAGESQAQYKNGVTVNYNAIAWGGVEYINLGNLTVTQLINSMNKNCKQDIMSAFDKFIQVKEKLSTMGEDFDAILSGVYKNDQSELKTLLEAWITAVQRFKQQNGDGIVVGILWGGIGTVSMNMLSEQEETNLKFGGAAQFSFAGTNGSASVKATYDGSRSDKNAKVQVTIVSSHYGSCMQPI
ncbi:MAG: hypothetical protein Q8K92_17875, partial [Leadbetterella sp.]|nr:hypothetical protein [Leadbetterella sp.]